MTLDAHHLACLLAIARTGSFSRAAVELGQSQPTLSNNIALLERRLGVKVLERSKRGSSLTPHGEILVRRAEGLQGLLEDAESEVRNLDMYILGPLKIGATPSVLPLLVPTALALMGNHDNNSVIEVVEGLDQSLTPKLQTGSLDIVVGPVGELFMDSLDVKETVLLRDPFCIAVGDQSRHHSLENASLTDLTGDAWILPRKGSTYREHVEALFMTTGVPWPRDCIFANSLPLLEAMICFSNRVTIVSPVQIRPPISGFRVIALNGGGYRQIGYKVRAKGRLSPLGLEFLQCLQAASHSLAGDPRLRQLGLLAG